MQTNHKTTYKTIIKAPVEKVWEALTDAKLVKQYFFGSNQETDWEVGSPIKFWGEYEGQRYEDKGEVLEYVHNENLAYSYLSSWNNLPDEPDNYLWVSYSIKPVDEGTELTVSQSNYDAEKAQHSEQNWGIVIDGLKKIVE